MTFKITQLEKRITILERKLAEMRDEVCVCALYTIQDIPCRFCRNK